MKQYIVRGLGELSKGITLIPDVHFGIFEATPQGNAIAYCRDQAAADHIAKLLNAEAWQREHD